MQPRGVRRTMSSGRQPAYSDHPILFPASLKERCFRWHRIYTFNGGSRVSVQKRDGHTLASRPGWYENHVAARKEQRIAIALRGVLHVAAVLSGVLLKA